MTEKERLEQQQALRAISFMFNPIEEPKVPEQKKHHPPKKLKPVPPV